MTDDDPSADDSRPAPFTPADCDLRGMPWAPLYGNRLFNSDFDAIASDAEFRAAVRLWWACWEGQVPAASLPANDRILAHLAGYGRDPKGWQKVKKIALHGFIECSDGRLYHRLLAEEAKISWKKRQKERLRKADYRAKKALEESYVSETVPRDMTRTGAARDEAGDTPSHADKTRQDKTLYNSVPTEPPPRSDGSEKPPAIIDARTELFREGVETMRALTGRSDGSVRAFVGRALKDLNDDAAVLLGIIREAMDLRPADPLAYIVGSVKDRSKPSTKREDKFMEGIMRAAGLDSVAAGPVTIDHEPQSQARIA